MRKVIYGAAIAAAVLFVTMGVDLRPQSPATAASPAPARATVDVRTLMSTIDVQALRRHDTVSGAHDDGSRTVTGYGVQGLTE